MAQPPQGGGGGGGQADASYQPLWLIALIVFAAIVIWYTLGPQLKTAFLWFRKYQLIALNYTLSYFQFEDITQAIDSVKLATRDTLTLAYAKSLSLVTGKYYRFLYLFGFTWFAWRIYFKNPLVKYKKKYSMYSLAKQEQTVWPQISIALNQDLLAEDLDSGPWAMGLTPMQWAKQLKLLQVDLAPQIAQFAKIKPPEFKVTILRDRAETAFAAQLGRPWQGPERLPLHRRAIFALLIARGCRDTKISQNLVLQLCRSAAHGKLNLDGVEALWKKHHKNREVQEICAGHAYELTLMISLLMFARQDGVLASSDFLWVKPMDRRLWFVINNVGRQTPAVEVGGIFNHWYHEAALKRPLSMPVVSGAVDALEIAVSEVIYQPDAQERDEIYERAKKAEGAS